MIFKIFIALVFAVLIWFFCGCTVTIPLGQDAKYGVVGISMSYHPPFPNVLADQPNIGGYRK
jgi:hypothetical protein